MYQFLEDVNPLQPNSLIDNKNTWVNENTASQAQKKPAVDLENFWLQDLENELIGTVDAVKSSVVSIIITKDFILYDGRQATGLVEQQVWWGSGILVSEEWYILTNKHVVDGADTSYTIIFSDGQAVEAEQAWLDKTLDIALLKVDASSIWNRQIASAIPFGETVQVGQFALAIWNALAEFQNSVTFWVVSGKNRKLTIDNENLYAWLLQTDTSISEWNSGWPLFDLDGQVVWINTAVSAFWENIGFAIPVSQEFIYATIASVQKYDELVRPFVGIRYVDLNSQIANELGIGQTQGIYVAEVVQWSAADLAGIQKEDILTHVDGIPVDTTNPFLYQLFTKSPWESVVGTILSSGAKKDVEIILDVQ